MRRTALAIIGLSALVLLLSGGDAELPAYRQTPAPSVPEFSRERRAGRYVLHTNSGQFDLDRLAALVEEAETLACKWLGGTRSKREVPVYLCTDIEEYRRIKFGLDLRRADRADFRGGYFHRVPMIVVFVTPRTIQGTTAHEVVHAVVAEATDGRCPDAIDEGLACYIAERLLAYDPVRWPQMVDWEQRRAQALGRVQRVPALERMLGLDYEVFHQSDREHYPLSWCLAKVLMESDRAKLWELLQAYAVRPPTWEEFGTLYNVDAVERAWHAAIEEAAAG
ncbi:MAG: hypothetical protein ACYTGN_03190 [Planctomycetota bacterium]